VGGASSERDNIAQAKQYRTRSRRRRAVTEAGRSVEPPDIQVAAAREGQRMGVTGGNGHDIRQRRDLSWRERIDRRAEAKLTRGVFTPRIDAAIRG
jgi:hypothetical protein